MRSFLFLNGICLLRRIVFLSFTFFVVLGLQSASFGDEGDNYLESLGKQGSREQMSAYSALLATPSKYHSKIIAGIKSSNPAIRKACVTLLSRIRDSSDYAALRERALKDDDWLVREQAIVAISSDKSPELIPVLERIAKEDAIVNNRVSAIRYLSHVAGVRSVESLRPIFKADTSLIVRLNAAREMALYGDKSGYKLARDSIHDSNWAVRYAAAGTLGYVGNQEDVAGLENMTNDPKEDGGVRTAAFSGREHIRLIHMSRGDQLSYLGTSLGDEHKRMREWAATELYMRKDDETKKLLKTISEKTDHPGRYQAASLLHESENE